MLQPARAMRVVAIAVISMSCAAARGPDPAGTDAHVDRADAPAARSDAAPPAIDAALDAALAMDAAFACKPANIIHGDGHHNAGMDCMDSCHNHGFSVAGTVLMADGVTPASDATVTVVDALGNSQDIIVSTNGNFFSFLPAVPPLTVRASLCPSVQVMITQASAGGCNANGCHMPGGVQGAIHL